MTRMTDYDALAEAFEMRREETLLMAAARVLADSWTQKERAAERRRVLLTDLQREYSNLDNAAILVLRSAGLSPEDQGIALTRAAALVRKPCE